MEVPPYFSGGNIIVSCGVLLVCVITLVFTINDTESLLNTDTIYPFLQLFYNSTQSKSAVNAMAFLVIFGITNCAIAETATASCQIWSF